MSGRSEPRVLRRSPGRARLHVPGLAASEGAVRAGIEGIPGVLAAHVNPRTENLLVHFDPAVVDESGLLAAVADCAPAAAPPPASLEREGGWLEARGGVTLSGPVARCVAVVTDFERYPEWQSYVGGVHVHERDVRGRGTLVEFRGTVAPGTAGEREVVQLMRYSYPSRQRITWNQVRGRLEAAEGSWGFRSAGPGRTRATYQLRIKPGWALSLLLRGETYERLRDVLLEHTFSELERRVAVLAAA